MVNRFWLRQAGRAPAEGHQGDETSPEGRWGRGPRSAGWAIRPGGWGFSLEQPPLPPATAGRCAGGGSRCQKDGWREKRGLPQSANGDNYPL